MELKRIGIEQKEAIKKLFISVFTIEPWKHSCGRRKDERSTYSNGVLRREK